jgi:hypothetical protein
MQLLVLSAKIFAERPQKPKSGYFNIFKYLTTKDCKNEEKMENVL